MFDLNTLRIGDEVLVNTNVPNGWPFGGEGRSIFLSGIREATIIAGSRHRIGFLVDGKECFPVEPETLITGYVIRQLEND